MQVLILPGYSRKNIEERDALRSALESHGHRVLAHDWRHWEQEGTEFSLEDELRRIGGTLEQAAGTDAFALIGKSVGTFVGAALLQGSPALAERTRRLLLLGVPLGGAGDEERRQLHAALAELGVPTTVVQNTKDTYGAADTVRQFLADLSVEFITREAGNHRYNYPELVCEIIDRG